MVRTNTKTEALVKMSVPQKTDTEQRLILIKKVQVARKQQTPSPGESIRKQMKSLVLTNTAGGRWANSSNLHGMY